MNGLEDIRIEVETIGESTAQVDALLEEIADLLEDFIDNGKHGGIDLRSLPMAPADYTALKKALGSGEVSAHVNALGPTHIRETAIHGVWWITHENSTGDTVAEFIEITALPAMLATDPDDIRDGLTRLRERPTTSTMSRESTS